MSLLPEEKRDLGGGKRHRGEEISLETGEKIELSEPYTGATSNIPDAMQAQHQLMAQVCCIAAAARLQALKSKIEGTEVEVFAAPMNSEDWFEYGRLMKWWDSFGIDNQRRLSYLVRELADGVEHVARLF